METTQWWLVRIRPSGEMNEAEKPSEETTDASGPFAVLRALLNLPGVELICAADLPGAPEVEEDGATFEANALKKAVALAGGAK